MNTWTDRRVITGWCLLAGCVVALIVAIAVGGVVSSNNGTVRHQQTLTYCTQHALTGAECAVLLGATP